MMLSFLHRKNKTLVSISKKQLKKFFMFEELRSKAIKYVYSQTDDLDTEMYILFDGLPDHYHVNNNEDMIDIIYGNDEGLGFTHPHWVNCFGEKIVCYIRSYSWSNGSQLKKFKRIGWNQFDFIPFFKGSIGNLYKNTVPVKMISDALTQFFKEIDTIYDNLYKNLMFIKNVRAQREFGLALNGNFYKNKKEGKNK